ncbi:Protein kinase domain - like 10 [Theobroma cacao]|nr:Protein kinase domain - like 10 [Theobroma cacao]
MHNFSRITYRELSEATGGFDDHKLIGIGSYGRVYRGVLQDGTSIAVKVLHLQTGNSTKILKRIRHRNLIRIITACSLPDFKALVLPYMANGSLESRIYPHSKSVTLLRGWPICITILPLRVIHCDLKPSNVLLNDDITALISDFGIAIVVMTVGAGNGAGAIETWEILLQICYMDPSVTLHQSMDLDPKHLSGEMYRALEF